MAFVENVAAFLEHALSLVGPRITVYNYVDKPDFDMNTLIRTVRGEICAVAADRVRIPNDAGMARWYLFDLAAFLTGRSFPVSSVCVRKRCATTQFESAVAETGFIAPVPLIDGLKRNVRSVFLQSDDGDSPLIEKAR